ncbi:MAG: hypothetical protein OHK0039_09730 [Bacteroidia bacterium]
MQIPAQYLPVMPYLILDGAADFSDFVQRVFGAEPQSLVLEDGRVVHGEIRIPGGAVVIFGGASENWPARSGSMYLHVADVDGVYAQALAAGAVSLEAPSTKDYGYTAGIADPFGNHWFLVQA